MHQAIVRFNIMAMIIICVVMPVSAAAADTDPAQWEKGMTEPIRKVVVRAPVSGVVDNISIEEGDAVKQGQLLVSMKNEMEKLDLERKKLMWKDKTRVNSTRVRAKILKEMYKNNRSLYQQSGSISEEELRKSELQYQKAKSQLKRLELQERKERIEYDIAEQRLNKKKIRAPFSGVISEIAIETGAHCKPHQAMLHLLNPEKCVLVCNVKGAKATKVQVGDNVELQVYSGGEWLDKKGTIVYKAPMVHSASGLVKLKARFENKNNQIIPGVKGRMLLQ